MVVLVLDEDSQALRALVRVIGNALPYDAIHSFDQVEEALSFAEKNLVDVCFLETHFGKRSGITVAGKIQKLYPQVNIVFCSTDAGYAMQALALYCSAYLMKPVSGEAIRDAVAHLRYPVEENNSPIYIQCIGNFEVFVHGEPIRFKYTRTKELLAYLVDRNGAVCSTAWIAAALFGDEEHVSYLKQLRKDLVDTFAALGFPEVIRSSKGALSINRNAVRCDYFEYRNGKRSSMPDEYMTQFSFID